MFAILFLIGIFFYVGLSCSIYRYVSKKTNKKSIKFITVFVLVLIAIGDNIVGETVFYYLCKTSGGIKIYKTADDVEGFYVENYTNGLFPLISILFGGKYKYVEGEILNQEIDLFAEGEGLYRFNISDQNDDNCRAYNLWKSGVMGNKVNYYEEYTSKEECISSNKINQKDSIYSVLYNDRQEFLPFIFISRTRTEIKNMSTGEIVAEANEYSYSGGWVLQLFFDGVGHTKSCQKCETEINKRCSTRELIYEALHPRSEF